jgi:hypothetical protein
MFEGQVDCLSAAKKSSYLDKLDVPLALRLVLRLHALPGELVLIPQHLRLVLCLLLVQLALLLKRNPLPLDVGLGLLGPERLLLRLLLRLARLLLLAGDVDNLHDTGSRKRVSNPRSGFEGPLGWLSLQKLVGLLLHIPSFPVGDVDDGKTRAGNGKKWVEGRT